MLIEFYILAVWVLTPVSTGSANFYLRSFVAVGAKLTLTENEDDYIVKFEVNSEVQLGENIIIIMNDEAYLN